MNDGKKPESNIVYLDGLSEKERWFAYFYENTSTMKNLLGIRDRETLYMVEKHFSRAKAANIHKVKFEGDFDLERAKAIHKYYFDDMYSWAGETRQVNMFKVGGEKNSFANYQDIEPKFKELADKIKGVDNLGKFKEDPELMARALCEVYLSINHIHAFREGNGRTQNEFVRQLAEHNGYKLDLTASMEKIDKLEYYSWFQHYDKTGDKSLVLEKLFKANLEKLQVNKIDEKQLIAQQFKTANQSAKNKIAEQTASLSQSQSEYKGIKK